ncbi:MAG: DNA-directed DNA polymerase [Candidatus Micrarchaeia archaeon]
MEKSFFIDLGQKIIDNTTYAEFILKNENGEVKKLLYQFDPYFYVSCMPKEKSTLEKLAVKSKTGEIITPKKVEFVQKEVEGTIKTIAKISCNTPLDVPLLRDLIPYPCLESAILYVKRIMLDFGIKPFSILSYTCEGNFIKKINKISESGSIPLSFLSFDIETYNPFGAPRPEKDPVIMISYCTSKNSGVLTYSKKTKKKFVESFENESGIIKKLCEIISKTNPDIIFAYNSSNFDIPYLLERSGILKIDFELGRWDSDFKKIKKGLTSGIPLNGRIHLDLYPMARFLGLIGILKSKKYTLEAVYNELGSDKKKMIERLDIWKMWDENDIEDLCQYSLMDAKTTYELGEIMLPLFLELSKLTGLSLFETSLSTTGQMVEFLLMRESVKQNIIIPSRPKDSTISQRLSNPIEGAFVKIPNPGIYENIVVMDFRGLYPSIIISYNIDPHTLTESKIDSHHSPAGWNFRKSPTGLIPSVLKTLVTERAKLKKELKMEKNTEKYKSIEAKSQSYKIISNSFYGYLGYARSRWYSRKCAESVTAWGRAHIQKTIENAEKAGFIVLYGDTDSVFLLQEKKSKKEVMEFLKSINKDLPEEMELELEGFFPSGVFVGKKSEEKGAKKKYALLAEDGLIKIRGFELVRRDWSNIAKKTQRRVLEIILKEKDKEKAAKVVKDTITELKTGKVVLSDLAIYTQISKDPKKYDLISPEISAARKAIEKGVPIPKGSLISYVITKKGKTISEKAELTQFAKDYDADYYINNQVLPSVMKILKELGFSHEDLKFGGKQTGLGGFL